MNLNDIRLSPKVNRVMRLAFYMATLIYSGLCFYIYYMQSLQPYGILGNTYYESDLPAHISMVANDGWYYSLTALIYLALLKLASGGTVLIAIFLAICTGLTIIFTEKLLCELGIENIGLSASGAFCINLMMPFFIKWAGMYRYVSYQSGNVWHNSTYICMKLFAVLTMVAFVRLMRACADADETDKANGVANRKAILLCDRIQLKWYVIFLILLALTTFVKPSFLTVFAPAFVVMLLIDVICRKRSFLNSLILGLSMLPSAGIILWQNSVLFGKDTDGGYKLSFLETFGLHADHPKVTVLLSLTFPIVIFAFLLFNTIVASKKKIVFAESFDRNYCFVCLMTFIGFFEAACLVETGHRATDGNFLWGYGIAMFILYVASFVKWCKFIKEKHWISFGVSSAVMLYQLICGIIFFAKIFAGETYFMLG